MVGRKITVLLYGGVGSGKSEVLQILKDDYHAYVLQSDHLAHVLYRKGAPGYRAICRICGKDVLDDNREIDRSKLGNLLYHDPVLMEQVNAAVHPMVYRKMADLIQRRNCGLVVIEQALIPDRPLTFVDEIWYVHSELAIRRQRLKDYRGYSDEKIDSILQSQPDESVYLQLADRVIENNDDFDTLRKNIHETIQHCQW